MRNPASAEPVIPPSGTSPSAASLAPCDTFLRRHLGPGEAEIAAMLMVLGYSSIDDLIDAAVPAAIRLKAPLDLPFAKGEHQTLAELRDIAARNKVYRSFIGMGYHDCIVPPVIQRNILENPGWYTAYTPYQAEIAQGRLEALLNFQTMITDLTGLDIASASLLDEATAAAEAVSMCYALRKNRDANAIFVSENCHPQTIDVIRTRAEPLGIEVSVCSEAQFDFAAKPFAILLQYPRTDGVVDDYARLIERAHSAEALAIVAADPLALTLLRPPGEFGADIAVGSAQRFGVPLGYGGPHAGYLATRDEFKRHLPGRLVGVSHDTAGRPAYRLSLQTREQHIRRDKATSNICTAQVLLAVMASMYAVYHGPAGLRTIAARVHLQAKLLARELEHLGYAVARPFFDTLRVELPEETADDLLLFANSFGINLRALDSRTVIVALDETTDELGPLLRVFNEGRALDRKAPGLNDLLASAENENVAGFFDEADTLFGEKSGLAAFARTSRYLTHPVFNKHHTETEMLRYIRRLEERDLSLTTSMIPLGSCTMKLNATAEMLPVTWPEFGRIHPFAPLDQARGYRILFEQLEEWLAQITGFSAVSLQPNAGSQGEYAGLLAIRSFHKSRGETHRNVCLIPRSAHGTNPASAAMAGFRVVAVECVSEGDIDLADLHAKAEQHRDDLACLMVTYPSTHGVFEETIRDICEVIHSHGGQVYMDGANMNAQVGLCRPGDIGADVCHLNLHKTFCIPHGGGGPGVGPIGVAPHLAEFLPGHGIHAPHPNLREPRSGAVSAAPWGSASILVIPWAYIRMMGGSGLAAASKVAILNANYIARRLGSFFPVLYKGDHDLVAHECILDLRRWKTAAGIEVEDVAKRLMDYGFHAPTVSWPVPGTIMIEPTESESQEELDRFCEAMIAIHAEMTAIEKGAADRQNNVLKNAPHTAECVTSDRWDRPYSREQAAYPAPWTRDRKFWPAVGRIDSVYGDRNLVCSCPPLEAFETAASH